jgi:hypothetical protein
MSSVLWDLGTVAAVFAIAAVIVYWIAGRS